jgi:hypothetical protein
VRTASRARACMRTSGAWLHTSTHMRHLGYSGRVRTRTVSTHSHWAAELPAPVAVRRAHVGYSEYSRYCEYLHEIPEYGKSMLSALTDENLKRTRNGLSPERQRIPRPGRVPIVARYSDQYPARHGARHGTRSTRMRWRRTRSGVGGRAGAVSGRRRARCTAAQRMREYSRPVGGVRIGVPGVPRVPGVRIGVLLVLTGSELRLDSHGRYSEWHREW